MRLKALLVLGCSLALACSGGSNGGGGGGGTTGGNTVADLAKAQHDASCAFVSCSYGFAPSQLPALCGTDSGAAALQKEIDAGRIAFDQTKAAGCISALQKVNPASCYGASPADIDKEQTDIDTACQGVLTGKVAAGASCYDKGECQGDSTCSFGQNQCPGKCAALVAAGGTCQADDECQGQLSCVNGKCTGPAAQGGDCSQVDCQAGLACVDGTCQQPKPAGQKCTDASECAAGLGCVYADANAESGTCTQRKATGADCTQDDECPESNTCFFADASADKGKCQAKGATGAACTEPAQLIFFPIIESPQCAGRQECVGVVKDENGATTKAGTCQPPQDVAGGCTPLAQGMDPSYVTTGCYFGLVCNPASKKCEVPPAAGSPCIEDQCNDSAYCASGTCQAKKADGQPCQDPSECVHQCDSQAKKCAPEPASAECVAP